MTIVMTQTPSFKTVATDPDCNGTITIDDCDDTDAGISPTALKICEDGVDNNRKGGRPMLQWCSLFHLWSK